VIEMGMNHPGEIAYLAPLGAPTVALVNNAQRAHLQGMGELDEVAPKRARSSRPVGRRRGGDQCRRCLCRPTGANANAGRAGCDIRPRPARRRARPVYASTAWKSRLELDTPEGEANSPAGAGSAQRPQRRGRAAACLAAGVTLAAVAEGLAAFAGTKGRLQRAGRGRQGAR
jgi:UDP-N-acetylmuramoyl-tripeptide--D-alanyl-D-alanine ligase